MGMDAQVIAIGPFDEEIVDALEYGRGSYDNVEKGVTVVTNVFVACTSEESRALALAFDAGPWELGSHHLAPHLAKIPVLVELFEQENVDRFLMLRDGGFDFYYLPNG